MTRELAILKGLEHAGRCLGMPPMNDWLRGVYHELSTFDSEAEASVGARLFLSLVREGFGDWISKAEIPAGSTVSMTSYKTDG